MNFFCFSFNFFSSFFHTVQWPFGCNRFSQRQILTELVACNFYKDTFVQKKPLEGALLIILLTIFDNHMILLKILAKFQKTVKEFLLHRFSSVQNAGLSFTIILRMLRKLAQCLICRIPLQDVYKIVQTVLKIEKGEKTDESF